MVFKTQLYEIWKPALNVESYICFMHSKLAAYFVPRLPLESSDFPKLSFLILSFFPPIPPSTSPSLPSEIDWHFADVITSHHYYLLSTFSHFTQISTTLHLLSICLQYSKPTWNPVVFGYLDNVECHPKPFRGLRFFWDFLILFFQVFSAMAFSGFWVWL